MTKHTRSAPPGETWDESIEAYLEARRALVTKNTMAIYRWHLRLLKKLCQSRGLTGPAAVREDDITAFHQRLLWQPGERGKMLSANTVYGALKTASLFFRWARQRNRILLDPMAELDLVKPFHRFPRVPTIPQLKKLLSTPSEKPAGLRDRAILELLYVLGLRRGECHRLDVTDLDLQQKTVLIREAKGRKDRLLPLSDSLKITLDRYLKKRPELRPYSDEQALFVTAATGRRLTYEGLRMKVQKLGKKAGLLLYPHALRHACAVHMLEAGADLRYVQELLGHAALSSTQLYTKIHPLELHQEFQKTHPRARRHREHDSAATGLSEPPED